MNRIMIKPNLVRNVTRCLSQNSTLIICRYSHSKKTHYDTLNLKSYCTNDEIRHAFAKLSKEYHPDTSKANNTEKSSRKFQEIMEAYRVLNKKASRDAYDAEIFRSESGQNHTTNHYHTYRGADYKMMRRYRAGEYNRYGPYGPYGPYRQQDHFNDQYKEQYDAWNSNPLLFFNRKRVIGFIIGFVVLNFMSVFVMYSATSGNRVAMNDIRDNYNRHRMGAHGFASYSDGTYSKTYNADDDPVVK